MTELSAARLDELEQKAKDCDGLIGWDVDFESDELLALIATARRAAKALAIAETPHFKMANCSECAATMADILKGDA